MLAAAEGVSNTSTVVAAGPKAIVPSTRTSLALSGDMVAILGTYGFGTLAAATFPIFVIGLLWRGASSRGVMLGMLTALATTLGGVGIEILKRFNVSEFAWPGDVPWYVFVLAASVIVTITASLLDSAWNDDQLDRRVRMALDL